MREAKRAGDVVHFGVFRADFRTGELRKQGAQIRLQDKPFQLLAALVQHPGELVTRDELRRTLWGDQTFVDFERSLNIAITKLRAALGDSADNPRFVETLPRRGYRFIAPLTVDTEHQTIPVSSGTAEIQAQSPQAKPEAPAVISEAAPGATEPRPARRPGRRRALVIGGLSLAAGATAAFVGIWVTQQPGPNGPLRVESLAVLPLENLSGDADQEFLADAVTDALITELGKIDTVRVISRTSIVPYKGAKKSLPDIGRELRVDAVVEGSVVRSGNRIRITAQLVHAASDRHLWAQVFERDVHDVLSLYDEVSEAIAREIHAKIDRSTTVAARRRGVDPEAWTLYMRGRYLWTRVTPDNLEKARDYFQQAIDKQADFAMAYAGLADAYLLLAFNRVQSPLEAIPRARAAALKALELDHSLAEAHTSLAGIACTFDADWSAAERGYRRAFEINPSYAVAHRWWGTTLAGLGRHAEAAAEIRRALEIDPVSLRANNAAGATLYLARRYPEAIEQYRKTLELEPSYAPSLIGLGRVYTALGRKTEALTELEHAATISNRAAVSLATLGYAYGVFGSRDQALNIVAELRERSTTAYVSPEDYAFVYLGLRDDHRVLQELERAAEERSSSLSSLKTALEYDPLRRNPRFADLLRRVNLN
jgi:TolB-like protein/DNA-binding winged helix-turn-helix (wHTH) protein/Tfp pilus assembly protein PilF